MRDELLFFGLTQQDNDEVKIGKKHFMNSLMPEMLSVVAKVPPSSSPPINVIKKGPSEGFRVVYRDLFLLKVLLRIELVTENRKVLIWENPQIMGHPNVE